MLRVRAHVRDGDLVRAPEPGEVLVVELARARPALGRAEDDHGPPGPDGLAARAGFGLVFFDVRHALLEGRRHGLVHAVEVVALYEVGRPAVPPKQVLELLVADARENRGVVDLVPVEVQHRQHRAVRDGIQELGTVPARGQRARLGLAVADHGQRDEVRMVEDAAERVADGVAQLAALVDTPGGLGGRVRADAAGEREPLEEALHALDVLGFVRVHLLIDAFQVGLREHGRRTVAWAGDEVGI